MLAVQRVVNDIGLLAAQRGNELLVGIERDRPMARLFERLADILTADERKLAFERVATHEYCNFCHCYLFIL